jgi:hypothetical protein
MSFLTDADFPLDQRKIIFGLAVQHAEAHMGYEKCLKAIGEAWTNNLSSNVVNGWKLLCNDYGNEKLKTEEALRRACKVAIKG